MTDADPGGGDRSAHPGCGKRQVQEVRQGVLRTAEVLNSKTERGDLLGHNTSDDSRGGGRGAATPR